VAARVVGVYQVVPAGQQHGARQAPRLDAQAPLACGLEQRSAAARQQRGFHARRGQAFDQPQRLPLAAAHFLSGIEVQDAHQLMFLALEYFRKT
jgi:hypothetical protein